MGRIKIDSAASLRTRLEAGSSFEDVVFQGVDLVPFEAKLLHRNLRGSVFLGCRCTSDFAPAFARYGCLVVPRPEGIPFDPFRNKLYSPEELLHRYRPRQPASYHSTPDRLTYLSCMDPETGRPLEATIEATILRRLHDEAIREALDEFLAAQLVRGVVGVVGGRDALRSGTEYRDFALLARDLTREGFLLVAGLGPGVPEAVHLGAYFAPYEDDDFDFALKQLSSACGDHRRDGAETRLEAPYAIREQYTLDEPARACSISIGSWQDGGEVPCPFATHHARYFDFSSASTGLDRVARHGLIAGALDSAAVFHLFQAAGRGPEPIRQSNPVPSSDRPAPLPPAAPLILFGPTPPEPIDEDDPQLAASLKNLDLEKKHRGELAKWGRARYEAAAWRLVESNAPGDQRERLLRTSESAAVVAFLKSYQSPSP